MNGAHDVGGMQGFGPIRPEVNEPVFHAPWEGRMLAMSLAVAAWGKFGVDHRRYARELIPPAQQLTLSYYQKWYLGLIRNMTDAGMVSEAEIQSGSPSAGSQRLDPALHVDRVSAYWSHGSPKSRESSVVAKFQVGQDVRARTINPTTHTRLPRYARGKVGVVAATYGVFVFPDANAHDLGETPQHLYSVRFTARELWGPEAGEKDTVYIDLWDDHLEAV